jgi:hypothetical protein
LILATDTQGINHSPSMNPQTIYSYQVKSVVLWDVPRRTQIFRRKLLITSSGLKCMSSNHSDYHLRLVGHLVYSLTLNTEAALFSETSVNFFQSNGVTFQKIAAQITIESVMCSRCPGNDFVLYCGCSKRSRMGCIG